MDKEKIMNLCQQIGLVATSNKKHYPALRSDFDFINDAQMDIFREITAPPKSNADRIRQMTDEELAKMVSMKVCRIVKPDGNDCPKGFYFGKCDKCVIAWLKQEVKEDDR